MRSEADIVDGEKFENLVTDYANFNEQFAHMSIKQKTSYFVKIIYIKPLDYKHCSNEYLSLSDLCN